jgi:hypothetical protein
VVEAKREVLEKEVGVLVAIWTLGVQMAPLQLKTW